MSLWFPATQPFPRRLHSHTSQASHVPARRWLFIWAITPGLDVKNKNNNNKKNTPALSTVLSRLSGCVFWLQPGKKDMRRAIQNGQRELEGQHWLLQVQVQEWRDLQQLIILPQFIQFERNLMLLLKILWGFFFVCFYLVYPLDSN